MSYRNLDRNWRGKSFPFGFLGLGIRVLGKWEEEHWVWAWEWIDCGGRDGAPEKKTVEEREKGGFFMSWKGERGEKLGCI